MAVLDSRKTEKALIKKGFTKVEKDHHYFELWYEGKLILWTKTSHNGQDINDYLISQMSRQCGLNKKDFRDLIDCPLSFEKYIEMLKESGDIE